MYVFQNKNERKRRKMKGKWILLLCVLLGFGLVFTSCQGRNKTSTDTAEIIDAFEGTWASTEGANGQPALKLVAENNSFRQYLIDYDLEVIRGTYSISGNNLVAKIAEVNTILFDGDFEWVNFDELPEIYKGYVGSETQEITIDNNTFTQGEVIFTKQ